MHAFSNREFLASLGLAITALTISALLMIGGYCLLAPALHPEFAKAREFNEKTPIVLKGNQFQPVVFGDGGTEGSTAVVKELAEDSVKDSAVLVHRHIFQANHFPFLRYHIEGRNPALRVILFWQRADTPGENFFLELDYSGEGPGIQNLLRSEDWKGTITELAVGFFGDLRGEPVKLHGVQLEAYSNRGLLEVVWQEWTAFEPWDQASINRYIGAPRKALVLPNGAVSAWLIFAMFIGWIAVRVWPTIAPRGRRFALPANLVFSFGIASALLSVLWTNKLLQQNQETRHLFAGKNLHERHLADWDAKYYALADKIKTAMPADSRKLIILYANPELTAPYSARLRYHLLPEKRVEHIVPITSIGWVRRATRDYDYILLVGDPDEIMGAPLALLEAQQYRPTGREVLLSRSPEGVLVALNKPKDEETD